jgi:hypothetical protein
MSGKVETNPLPPFCPREGTQISPRIWRVVCASKSRLHGVDQVGTGIIGDEAITI